MFDYLATDGYENSSKYYKRDHLKKMVKSAKEKYNIEVVYLAANQDAILEAGNLGIDPNQAINYNESSDTTEAVYRSVARVASSQRSNPDGNVSFTLPERQASQPQEPVDDHLPPPIIRSHRISRVRAED